MIKRSDALCVLPYLFLQYRYIRSSLMPGIYMNCFMLQFKFSRGQSKFSRGQYIDYLALLLYVQATSSRGDSAPLLGSDTRRERRVGKINFVEHRSSFHLYHSFHRLWIFLACMFQVDLLSENFLFLLSYLFSGR